MKTKTLVFPSPVVEVKHWASCSQGSAGSRVLLKALYIVWCADSFSCCGAVGPTALPALTRYFLQFLWVLGQKYMCSLVKEISFSHTVPVLWVRDRCWFCFVMFSLPFRFLFVFRFWIVLALPWFMSRFFPPHLPTLLTHSDFKLTTRHRGNCFHFFLHKPPFSWSLLIFFFDSFLPLPGFYFPN